MFHFEACSWAVGRRRRCAWAAFLLCLNHWKLFVIELDCLQSARCIHDRLYHSQPRVRDSGHEVQASQSLDTTTSLARLASALGDKALQKVLGYCMTCASQRYETTLMFPSCDELSQKSLAMHCLILHSCQVMPCMRGLPLRAQDSRMLAAQRCGWSGQHQRGHCCALFASWP